MTRLHLTAGALLLGAIPQIAAAAEALAFAAPVPVEFILFGIVLAGFHPGSARGAAVRSRPPRQRCNRRADARHCCR